MQRIVRTLALVIFGGGLGIVVSHVSVTLLLMRQNSLQTEHAERAQMEEGPASKVLPGSTNTATHKAIKFYGTSGSHVQIRADHEAWIQVVSYSRDLMFTRVMRFDEIYGVPDRADILLSTGDGGAFTIIADGNEIGPLGKPGQGLRHIALSNLLPAEVRALMVQQSVNSASAASAGEYNILMSPESRCETWNAASGNDRDRFIRNGVAGLSAVLNRDARTLVPYVRGCLDKLFVRPCVTGTMSVPEGSARCIQMGLGK